MPPITRRRFLRNTLASGAALAAGGSLGCGAPEAHAPHVPPLRLGYGGFAMGIQSWSLRHYTLDAALEIVEALGLSRIELIPATGLGSIRVAEHLPVTDDGPTIDAALAACRARGIQIAAHGVNAVPDAETARALFAFAKRARIPVLSIAPDESALDELDALCRTNPGVRLAIHNHGPHLPWETVDEILAAIESRHPALGACVDTGHFIRSGIDPVGAIRRFGARAHGVHLKDFVEAGALADGCILGDGRLDLDAVFRALREVEFSGALSLEYEENPENVVPDLVACLEAASEAAERVAGA
ncbi:MAG TPA: sugar phosphate isomerase/epimerase [Myxococcota bacterium]|nr:sugar phosphate isomerase/epimerase [Myxococcota bacterium]